MNITLQILFNSLVSGLLLSLVAIGFTYIFRVTKVFHLAHGGVYVASGYAGWWACTQTGSFFLAIPFAFLVSALLILLIEKTVYIQIAKRKSNESITLIASSGIFVIIVNTIALIFGNENKVYDNAVRGILVDGFIIVSNVQFLQLFVSALAILLFVSIIYFAKLQKQFKAISDNATLAKVYGINTTNARLKVLVLGSFLVCVTALLKSLETGIDPQTGMAITLEGIVITILVGRLSPSLLVLFSVCLTTLQNTIDWFLNAQWKNGITFFILLLVILYRTEGVISYNLRRDNA